LGNSSEGGSGACTEAHPASKAASASTALQPKNLQGELIQENNQRNMRKNSPQRHREKASLGAFENER